MIAVVSTAGGNEASALDELAAGGALADAAEPFEVVSALTAQLLAGLSTLSIDELHRLGAREE